jgi:predicted CoA-binding protein
LKGLKKTLVIGASTNPERYSYLAITKLLLHQHPVVALGNKKGSIQNVVIENDMVHFNNIHTVTLYINATLQKEYYDYILSLKPKRIIFNPGTENIVFTEIASNKGILCMNSCTLVLLASKQY